VSIVALRVREGHGWPPADEWMVGFGERIRLAAERTGAPIDAVVVTASGHSPTLVRVTLERIEADHQLNFIAYFEREDIETHERAEREVRELLDETRGPIQDH
jgi:hypothetical protein